MYLKDILIFKIIYYGKLLFFKYVTYFLRSCRTIYIFKTNISNKAINDPKINTRFFKNKFEVYLAIQHCLILYLKKT